MSYPDIGDVALTESTSETDAGPDVGSCIVQEGKKYCYVYNAGAASTAAGDVVGVFLTGTTPGQISMTAATQLVNTVNSVTLTVVAGIAVSTIATTEYGWIQVGGHCDNITTDGNITTTSMLVCADNAIVASVGDETMFHCSFGYANAADSSTTLATAQLRGCAFNS